MDTRKKMTLMEIKTWYLTEYPSDDLGVDLNWVITFEDCFDFLSKKKGDFYKFIGVTDSVVRERIFEKISELYLINYNDIYNNWLDKKKFEIVVIDELTKDIKSREEVVDDKTAMLFLGAKYGAQVYNKALKDGLILWNFDERKVFVNNALDL